MSNPAFFNVATGEATPLTVGDNLVDTGSAPIQIRNGSMKVSVDPFTGEVSETFSGAITAADLGGDLGGYTARNKFGNPVGNASSLQDTDIIQIHGTEVTVEVAKRLGLLTSDNKAADVNAVLAQPQAAPQEMEMPPVEALDAPTETILGDLLQSTEPGSQIKAFIDIADQGHITEQTMTRLASEAGIHPDQMRKLSGQISAGFQKQADKVVGEYVADPSAVYEWAKQHHAGKLQDAIMRLGTERSTAGFRALAQEYFKTADMHSPHLVDAINWKPGVTVTRGQRGELIIRDGNSSESWANLVRSGDFSRYVNG